MRGALLVAGTHSDAGKSVVVAGICRWLSREGVRVAPFKAQNMALNSYVTREGAEIGRAQAAQAAAAGIEPEAAMNPVLLKPSAERETQVIVRGKPYATATAKSYGAMKKELLPIVLESLAELRRRFDVVVCEGAGSPAEINLRPNDIANMGLARAANLPVVVVGDIDRGGLFASLYGTLALLSPEDQGLIAGFLVNKFRGDPAVLEPGLRQMGGMTGRPFFGTLPHARGLSLLDGEDSLALDVPRSVKPPVEGDVLRVAVARLGRISNFTDLDGLSHEPGVRVRFTESPEELFEADLAVLPGTKATVDDLAALRARGLDRAILERVEQGLPTLGICGGYQMMGTRIADGIESRKGEVVGLGLLPVETVFGEEKILGRPEGYAPLFGASVAGYEIRHGRVSRSGGEPLLITDDLDEGCISGETFGTSWHGVFESDAFRRAYLRRVAAVRGLDWTPGDEPFAVAREAQLDRLGDLIAENVDREAILRLVEDGAPVGLSLVPPAGAGASEALVGREAGV